MDAEFTVNNFEYVTRPKDRAVFCRDVISVFCVTVETLVDIRGGGFVSYRPFHLTRLLKCCHHN
jgi:hypothetical protein